MKYLLDTNVISELRRKSPDKNVANFISNVPEYDIFVCAISIGELSYGMNKLTPGSQKMELDDWLRKIMLERFAGRIIDIDADAAMEWGRIAAECGRTLPVADSMIAAAAVANGLILLTRNAKDFDGVSGLRVINPWLA